MINFLLILFFIGSKLHSLIDSVSSPSVYNGLWTGYMLSKYIIECVIDNIYSFIRSERNIDNMNTNVSNIIFRCTIIRPSNVSSTTIKQRKNESAATDDSNNTDVDIFGSIIQACRTTRTIPTFNDCDYAYHNSILKIGTGDSDNTKANQHCSVLSGFGWVSAQTLCRFMICKHLNYSDTNSENNNSSYLKYFHVSESQLGLHSIVNNTHMQEIYITTNDDNVIIQATLDNDGAGNQKNIVGFTILPSHLWILHIQSTLNTSASTKIPNTPAIIVGNNSINNIDRLRNEELEDDNIIMLNNSTNGHISNLLCFLAIRHALESILGYCEYPLQPSFDFTTFCHENHINLAYDFKNMY